MSVSDGSALLLAVVWLGGCGAEGLKPATRAALLRLSPEALPAPPPDVSNRFADDAAAAALGQRLFFDPGLSGPLLDSDNDGSAQALGRVGESGKVACAGCHIPHAGFSDDRSARRQVSLAAGWGKRRAPSLLDVGQATLLMWDGRRDTLYNQPIGALENGVETNSSRLYAALEIYRRYRASYEAIFGPIPVPLDDAARFPQLDGQSTGCRQLASDATGIESTSDCHGVPGDGAEFDQLSPGDQDEVTRVAVNMGKAIAAYERRLGCGPSRFDAWIHGKGDALSASEQRGAALFVETGCDSCHSGPFLSDRRFHNVGLHPGGVGIAGSFVDLDDHGALEGLEGARADPLNVSGKFSDGDDGRLAADGPDGAMRTPGLRCVSQRPSFMHTGQITTLAGAVAFFDRGGDASGYPGIREIAPLGLTTSEREDLVAFLRALDGPGPAAELLAPP